MSRLYIYDSIVRIPDMSNMEDKEDDVKLFGEWSSPFAYRIVWALKLKGIKYEYVEVDLHNKSDLLLNYNPIHKKVPVLVHGGKPIVESTVILEYIDETWPGNLRLVPNDPYERSVARFWAKFIDDKVPIFWKFFSKTGEEQDKAMKEIMEILKILEEKGIQEKNFFGGESIGLVDIVFGWMAYWFGVMEEVVGIKLFKAETFPHLYAWMENFKGVPMIKENIFDHNVMFVHFKRLREMFTASQSNV